MSQTAPTGDNKPNPEAGSVVFKRKGFQFMGLGTQDFIRFFFGGNASLAIIILILICVFLAKEAFMFFPQHHAGLKDYRQSGQEFVDYIGDEIGAHTNLYSSANIAYFAEVNRTSREEDDILRAHRAVLANLENLTSKTWGRFEREVDALEDVGDDLEDLDPAKEEDQPKIAALQEEKERLEKEIVKFRVELKEEVSAAINTNEAWELGVGSDAPPPESLPKLREAVLFEASPEVDEEHPYIAELKAVSKAKKAAAVEEFADFKATLKAMQDVVRPLKSLHSEIRSIASENKAVLVKLSTAADRKEAWIKGAAATKDPDEKARMLAEAEKVVIEAPDYDAMAEPFYEVIPEHAALIAPIDTEMAVLFQQLPDKVETRSAHENLKRAKVYYDRFVKTVAENRENIKGWSHEKPVSAVESVSSFLFGRDWITNSSWHDVYGLLPIFTGSLLISIIALVVAVPFAVSAAIYVNQLAPLREQNFVKPAIEFIEAIPSVVLGFFGILVFGETLRVVSQVEWLQWVPGFPMAERLTILNAGLLLAFMAIPTIFTLTEDALNNIPQALTENSLAMGASKLQTVFRVVVPTAVSGIIAAVLLGFGRIIGETMVVLLVAGNKIKIPDFTEGIGVIAQPTHTMTGIIAQELAEVDAGSLHWRALFMVGMVLFAISLIVNFSAQRVLKRFQKI
ncbi:MAG: phosphate ABC transporter permease subunit PstC [Verrucomicrobiales bacterium]|nr:phosphate ABC transporter permease subunit PstC [Verrucomicrobiales bacterium]